MNLCDAYVQSVTTPAYEKYGKWWVVVTFVSWGYENSTTIMFDTKEEAEKVGPGFHFLA
jgi:hypothetical protein